MKTGRAPTGAPTRPEPILGGPAPIGARPELLRKPETRKTRKPPGCLCLRSFSDDVIHHHNKLLHLRMLADGKIWSAEVPMEFTAKTANPEVKFLDLKLGDKILWKNQVQQDKGE